MAPKTYFAYDEKSTKISSKGISHNANLCYENFYNCLYNDISNEIVNTSFRVKQGNMHTVAQKKTGLNNIHIKTFIKEDRITTVFHDF